LITGRINIPSVFIGGVSVGGCNDGGPGIRPLIAQGGLDAALERCSEVEPHTEFLFLLCMCRSSSIESKVLTFN
jgi:hypothetical protein